MSPSSRNYVIAPAGDGVVGAQPASMLRAGGNRFEVPIGRNRGPAGGACVADIAPVAVIAPAGDGVVGAQPAGVVRADGDSLEASVGLVESVVFERCAPAFYFAITAECAGVTVTMGVGVDGLEAPSGGVRLAGGV